MDDADRNKTKCPIRVVYWAIEWLHISFLLDELPPHVIVDHKGAKEGENVSGSIQDRSKVGGMKSAFNPRNHSGPITRAAWPPNAFNWISFKSNS